MTYLRWADPARAASPPSVALSPRSYPEFRRVVPMSMYAGFTDRACRVLLEMRDEAFLLDHDHTGTEHLLLAILEVNDDLTSPVLRRFGVNEADLRREVQKLVTPDLDVENGAGAQIHFIARDFDEDDGETVRSEPTDNAASAREFTPRLLTCLMRLGPFEAQELGDDHVGSEHLLLAVLKEGHGVAVEALANLGIDVPQLTLAIYERIAEAPESSDPTVPQPSEKARQAKFTMRRAMAQSRMNMEDRVVVHLLGSGPRLLRPRWDRRAVGP